jgi:hypothetical protein
MEINKIKRNGSDCNDFCQGQPKLALLLKYQASAHLAGCPGYYHGSLLGSLFLVFKLLSTKLATRTTTTYLGIVPLQILGISVTTNAIL